MERAQVLRTQRGTPAGPPLQAGPSVAHREASLRLWGEVPRQGDAGDLGEGQSVRDSFLALCSTHE